jgi:hypothetical protein
MPPQAAVASHWEQTQVFLPTSLVLWLVLSLAVSLTLLGAASFASRLPLFAASLQRTPVRALPTLVLMKQVPAQKFRLTVLWMLLATALRRPLTV